MRRIIVGLVSIVAIGVGMTVGMAGSPEPSSTQKKAVPQARVVAPEPPPVPQAEPPVKVADDLTVHEWGTFLAVSGSDGLSLDGLYHEEHALPGFVHARSRDQLRQQSIFVKGETPVIYFYTATKRYVRVEVKFPRGLWTQWYPQAAFVGPTFSSRSTPESFLRDGRIVWSAGLIPASASETAPALPETSADALWNFARDVDAAYVQTGGAKGVETERYLFYRGLGTTTLPVRMSSESGGTLSADRDEADGIRHVFVLRVERGKAAYAYRPALEPGETAVGVIPSMDGALPLDQFADKLADDLAGRLVESGLYAKEARAMVETWKTSYFKTEGVRALFVLSQRWTDAFIPMKITPKPKDLVRVMVGRLELLTPEREQLTENAVRDLASADPARRLAAFNALGAEGRYVEPILRRVLASSRDERVKQTCRRLLMADFVTDLRSAIRTSVEVKPAAEAMVWNEEPAHIRARLASLLKELAFDAEARAEGEAAVALLKQARALVPQGTCDAQRAYRAWGRALEALGDDRGAAEQYGRVIDQGWRALQEKDCRTCHQKSSVATDAWPRDWWAGERYASSLRRSGGLDAAIDRLEKASASDRLPNALKLGYLYAAKGRDADADSLRSAVDALVAKLETASLAPPAR